MIEYVNPGQNDWQKAFEAHQLDVVPDPMVMRVADLFIGGRSFSTRAGLDASRVWGVIERNVDSLITFFHLLMTRDRIPLIDYEYTFNTTNFAALGDIAVAMHPPIYNELKERAKHKLSKIDFNRIPAARRAEMARDRTDEFEAVAYGWFPDPGKQFVGEDRVLGAFLLGGLIFGGYSQVSGSDHVLQPSRQQLLMELTQPDEAPLWGAQQEAALFKRLNEVVSKDERLSAREVQLPPTILPFLLNQRPATPKDLLEKALDLRSKDADFKQYRRWHRELRAAWEIGSHNESAEQSVVSVTQELAKRYPVGKTQFDVAPIWSREIGIKPKVGVKAVVEAGVKAGVEAGVDVDLGKTTVALPNWIRNWIVEGIFFRGHRKVLLQMAVAQHQSDNLVLGLKRLWDG